MEEDVHARLKAAATVLVSSALALGLAEGALHWNADGHRAVFEALREGVRALAYGKIPSSM